jgi:hypothetical protein
MRRLSFTCIAALTLTACGGDELDGPALPELLASAPSAGVSDVPRGAWIVLSFDGAIGDGADLASRVRLSCSDCTPGYDLDVVGDDRVVINPRGEIQGDQSCTVSWVGAGDTTEEFSFDVAAAGDTMQVPQDHSNTAIMDAFPDDFWLVPDAAHPSGKSLVIPIPDITFDARTVVGAFQSLTEGVDGFSPATPIVVNLPEAIDPASIPATTEASLDPTASLALYDTDPDSTSFGQRLPFYAVARDEINNDGTPARTLLVFPGMRLEPRGSYVFAVTKQVYVTPGQPLLPSEFHRQALGLDDADGEEAQRSRDVLTGPLDFLETTASPPIRRDDIALALSFTIRSMDDIGADLLSIREQTDALPAPTFTIDSVTVPPSPTQGIAAHVTGTWTAPVWNDEDYFARDDDGLPVPNGTRDIGFVLAIPASAETTPAPVIMYQHGTPGSAEEVRGAARSFAGEFAVIGFTDMLNRDFDGFLFSERIFLDALANRAFPDTVHHIAIAEQLAFIRLIAELRDLDVLPVGAPDGEPDLDVDAPLSYLGISQGSNHGVGLMPYAPEIRAAALVVGAGRYSGILMHQVSGIYDGAIELFPAIVYRDGYVALAMAQIGADAQDPINHAQFLYENPHDLAAGDDRASVLLVEGLGDTLTPPWSMHATANELGIPLMNPVKLSVPFLDTVEGPLTANIDASTTAGLFQYVPAGYPGVDPTPTCEMTNQTEGHFCAQIATEAIQQRLEFFRSAQANAAPTIVAPIDGANTLPLPSTGDIAVTRAAPLKTSN